MRFFVFSILPFIPFFVYVLVGPGFSYFLKVQAVLWNLKDLLVVGGKGELIPQLFHSWVEFFLLHILTIIGAIWSIKNKRCDTDLLILNKGARGEVIVGEHGAFVKGALKWIWVDRDITRAIEIEPDWLVTYPNRVRITGEEPDKVKVYHIGPYLVLHSHPPGHMKDVVAPVDFPKWRFRK